MEKIEVLLKNCYGIKNFKHVFNFKNKEINIIYAPNGTMKTSFANTFDDYSKKKQSEDKINKNALVTRNIRDEKNGEIDCESIFVIKSFEQSFKTEKMSTLLVNEKLKEEYDEIFSEIGKEKIVFEKNLKSVAGFNKDIIKAFCEAFKTQENNFFELLISLEKEIHIKKESMYENIKYKEIFDEKIIKFIQTKEFNEYIREYIEKYEELLDQSDVFNKKFNHNTAQSIQKELSQNGYFEAKHEVVLNVNGKKEKIQDSKKLLSLFNQEKEKILKNEELKLIFDKIDKKLTNSEVKNFRNLLLSYPEVLNDLGNLESLKKEMWKSYLRKNKDQLNVLLIKYKKGQEKINKIIKKAKDEVTVWENVVNIFNSRFYVPYKIEIENKEEAILKQTTPNLKYVFINDQNQSTVEESALWNILSQGEKRALYLLNIIFEIESRKQANQETLFIIDDIADSFDYKNKYAIIEYINEFAQNPLFKIILLTHNFDFMRTVRGRICGDEKYKNTFLAVKYEDKIVLEEMWFNYFNNPLKFWKQNINEPYNFIAALTFVRNLAEYINDEKSMEKLTQVLHIMEDTKNITLADVEVIYKEVLKNIKEINFEDKERKMFDIILESADYISEINQELAKLEQKIVLSIAIRLIAEEYMLKEIQLRNEIEEWGNNQFGKIYSKFKTFENIDKEVLKVLEKVSIMVPENIHLNSFMFEPLLDLSDKHLKELYTEIKHLKEESVMVF